MRPPVLFFVAPCLNEEDVLPHMAAQLAAKLDDLVSQGRIDPASRALFVDDGSIDATWDRIRTAARRHPSVEGISLGGNHGQQRALYAGLCEDRPRCDVAISLDADGEHDLDAVDAMLDAYAHGNQVVCATRSNPRAIPAAKRWSAQAYYTLLSILGMRTVPGGSDYRLVSAQAIDELEPLLKTTVFLRAIFPRLPLKSATVPYFGRPRAAGTSSYTLPRMMRLAIDGLVSSGPRPTALLGLGGTAQAALAMALRSGRSGMAKRLGAGLLIAGGATLLLAGACLGRLAQGDQTSYTVTDRCR